MDCTDHALEEFRFKHFLVAFVDFRVGMFVLCINSEDYCIPETFGSNLISSTIPRLSTRSFNTLTSHNFEVLILSTTQIP